MSRPLRPAERGCRGCGPRYWFDLSFRRRPRPNGGGMTYTYPDVLEGHLAVRDGRIPLLPAVVAALTRWPLPELKGGAVVQWRLPLQIPPDVTEMFFLVECPVLDSADRVREPW